MGQPAGREPVYLGGLKSIIMIMIMMGRPYVVVQFAFMCYERIHFYFGEGGVVIMDR